MSIILKMTWRQLKNSLLTQLRQRALSSECGAIRQSLPDSGLGFQAKVLNRFKLSPRRSEVDTETRKVDIRLPEKRNPKSHGERKGGRERESERGMTMQDQRSGPLSGVARGQDISLSPSLSLSISQS